jgi:hypothetical protein
MRSKSVDGSASKAGRRGVLRRRICFGGGWRIIWLERGREMKALEVGFDREPGRVRKHDSIAKTNPRTSKKIVQAKTIRVKTAMMITIIARACHEADTKEGTGASSLYPAHLSRQPLASAWR